MIKNVGKLPLLQVELAVGRHVTLELDTDWVRDFVVVKLNLNYVTLNMPWAYGREKKKKRQSKLSVDACYGTF